MTNHKNIQLTASEISTLWTSYQNDSVAICGLKSFLTHVEDEEIRSLLERTLTITEQEFEDIDRFFKNENYPIPQGFSDQDVNLNAPRLFSDKLYLEYVLNMTIINMAAQAASLISVARTDLLEYYTECLSATQELHIRAKELSKEKGMYIRTPNLPKPNQIDFVKKQSFIAGWLTDRRPLLGIEITNLVFNAKRNALGQALITGFSQVGQSKEVRKFFERGREISQKHVEVFSSILHEEYLSGGSQLLTPEVTESTVSPFSDKLMMFLVTGLITSGIGQYGTSMTVSPRHDLGVQYTRLMAEIVSYANDGATIMIDNGWMEQPPMAADRKGLAK